MRLKPIPLNTVVHTPTEEEAKELLGILGKVYKISAWDKYNDQLAYRVSETIPTYANVEWYKMQKGLTILTLAEFKEKYVIEEKKPKPKFEVGDWVIYNHKNRELGQIVNCFPDEECRYSVRFGDEYHVMDEHQLLPYTEPETKPTEGMETKENRNLSQDVANCDKPEDKELNLCELLQGHDGETFYSPFYGAMVLMSISDGLLCFQNSNIGIDLLTNGQSQYAVDGYCAIFPSKTLYEQYPLDPYTAWMKWQEEQKKHWLLVTAWIDDLECESDTAIDTDKIYFRTPRRPRQVPIRNPINNRKIQ